VFLLVPAYPGCPGQKPLNGCVCVRMLVLPFLPSVWQCVEPATDKESCNCAGVDTVNHCLKLQPYGPIHICLLLLSLLTAKSDLFDTGSVDIMNL